MSDERLDRLIDEVARQMTDGHPSSDFRARVIANLDRHPGHVWRPIWIVAPLGTIAVAVLVIVVARPFQGRDRGPERAARQQRSQVAKTETATVVHDTPTVRLPPSPGSFGETRKADTTYERSRGTRVVAADRRQDPSRGAAAGVAALAPPPLDVPPLGVDAIGIDALPTDSIAVTQLDAIAPIAIDPLTTVDARPPTDY
jgi:hypothetical protein